jgi:triacylglycerol lipase
MGSYFSAKDLLEPPTERAAFSDRQAYVCAELSKLAYFRFEGGHSLEQALEVARAVLGDDPRLTVMEAQLKLVLSSGRGSGIEAQAVLAKILKAVDHELVKTFSNQGTQAFLCTREVRLDSGGSKKVAYLVFRGTEPCEFVDIKADVRAALRKVDIGGEQCEMHTGYLEALDLVRDDIEAALNETPHDQLILTGHSLGGALAMVATRLFASDTTGACYTFGAPPIGAIEVQNRLKTPIYEIINETDIVPRLPNPWMTTAIVMLLRLVRLLAKSVTLLNTLLARGTWDEQLEAFTESMTRYRHPGYVSYLVGTGSEARLRINVDSFDRFKWWLRIMWKQRFSGIAKMLNDHSIDLYITKLKTHARKRH